MRRLLGLGPNVLTLGVVSLLTDISSEMVYPLVPLFVVSVLGATYLDVGTIEGVAESTAGLLKVFSGWFSDKLGRRKPIVVLGYSASAIAKPLLALASGWTDVLGLRFLDRFGKGVRTSARDAIIAESCDGLPGRAFGFHRAMDTTGAVMGPLIASVLLAMAFGFSAVFLIAFVPALIGVVILFLFVREAKSPERTREERLPEARLNPRYLSGRFKAFLVVLSIFAIGNSSDVFLILRAQNVGAPVAVIPLLYVVMNIVYAAVSLPVGIISDRVGRRTTIAIGFVVFALAYGGFAFVISLIVFAKMPPKVYQTSC